MANNQTTGGQKKGGNPYSAKNAKSAAKVRAIQQQKRQRIQWSVGIVVFVIAGVAVIGLAYGSRQNSKKTQTAAASGKAKAPASIGTGLAGVPLTTIAAARKSRLASDKTFADLKPITAPALTQDGKPHILYVGAEYCPYCGGERWAMVTALSKFGTFSNLSTTHSSTSDQPSDIPTLSFHGATYTSKYVSFTGRETQGNTLVNGNYPTLDTLTAVEQKLLAKYDAPPYVQGQGGSIPFIDFGGKFVQSGASYDVTILQGKSHQKIVDSLSGTGNIATAVNSTAGVFIKAICTLTKNQPADVCKAIAAG